LNIDTILAEAQDDSNLDTEEIEEEKAMDSKSFVSHIYKAIMKLAAVSGVLNFAIRRFELLEILDRLPQIYLTVVKESIFDDEEGKQKEESDTLDTQQLNQA
jgi:hypothetical protein